MGKWVTGNTGRTEGNESSQQSPDQGANPDRCFCAPGWLRVWLAVLAVLYRLCWRSLGARAHRTWSRRGNRRWRGSEEGGSLVAHSPAVEAKRCDSLGFGGHRTHDTWVSVVTQHRGIFKGEMMWKRSKSGVKGSDVIHALMHCLYMQLIWIQFAPCVHNGHTIDAAAFICLCSRT